MTDSKQVDVREDDVVRVARALCRYAAEACNTHPDDEWKFYSDDFKAQARIAMAAIGEVTDEIVEHVQYSLDNHEDNRAYAEEVSARSVREALEAVWPTRAALAACTPAKGEGR